MIRFPTFLDGGRKRERGQEQAWNSFDLPRMSAELLEIGIGRMSCFALHSTIA
jgi:hypothetical protein